ncbi:MAG: diaminopimelate epimerase [Bdellovibrionales bacterium]|nr:diaminopimelate epimerase [Bdellovibrionales bacterium]
MNLKFEKWTGTGNDFILVDLRESETEKVLASFKKSRAELAIAFSRRTQSMGADGLIFLTHGEAVVGDVAWDFYNADGSSAEMCGNAARCVGAYELRRSHRPVVSILTVSGAVSAKRAEGANVSVLMRFPILKKESHSLELSEDEVPIVGSWIDSGVPHFVIPLPELQQLPSREYSAALRAHPSFGLGGANITYVVQDERVTQAVTYERGVENYTQACGTGAIAAAFFVNLKSRTQGRARTLQMPGGLLDVSWTSDQAVLTGGARQICIGYLTPEAM